MSKYKQYFLTIEGAWAESIEGGTGGVSINTEKLFELPLEKSEDFQKVINLLKAVTAKEASE